MDLNSDKFDYRYARPLGVENAPWERVIDDDSPVDFETGKIMGPPDVFKLEFSGWNSHIEFKPKN